MEQGKRLNIAIIGSKGLPAVFGGIERHVEEIGSRLAERGHRITVYGRKAFSRNGTYRGMRVRVLPSIPTKNLDTATNSFAATVDSLTRRFDIFHYHGIGPSIFSWIPSGLGLVTVATIHAHDYWQSKWGNAAKRFLRLGERTAVRRCRTTIAVSKLMAGELSARFGKHVDYIPNGATLYDTPPFDRARSMGLEREEYILTVGRFIPERGFHTLLEGFKSINTTKRLVIVGDERFEEEYASRLRGMADKRVLFPGYITGPLLNELYAHCAFYVLPSTVEGLPISLIEAMSFSRPVLISDIPENLEVARDVGVSFRSEDTRDLAEAISSMLEMDRNERELRGRLGRELVERSYTWDIITDTTESLYRRLLSG